MTPAQRKHLSLALHIFGDPRADRYHDDAFGRGSAAYGDLGRFTSQQSADELDLTNAAVAMHQHWQSIGLLPAPQAPRLPNGSGPSGLTQALDRVGHAFSRLTCGAAATRKEHEKRTSYRMLRDGALAVTRYYGLPASDYNLLSDQELLRLPCSQIEKRILADIVPMNDSIVEQEFGDLSHVPKEHRPYISLSPNLEMVDREKTSYVTNGYYRLDNTYARAFEFSEELSVEFRCRAPGASAPESLYFTPLLGVWGRHEQVTRQMHFQLSTLELPPTFFERGPRQFERLGPGRFQLKPGQSLPASLPRTLALPQPSPMNNEPSSVIIEEINQGDL